MKDLRKTCATYHDANVPESSVEILGHSVGGITYWHYAHRAPLAFRAIMTLPQPSAFSALVRGSTASARAAGGSSPTQRDKGDVTEGRTATVHAGQPIGCRTTPPSAGP